MAEKIRYPTRLIPQSLLLAGTLLMFVMSSITITVPPMDDTYIHLVYGRSLYSSSPLSFAGGAPSSGFTSPLWLMPSAAAASAGTDLAVPALILLSLAAAAAGISLLPWVSGLILVLAGPVFFHSASGMETSAAVLAVILTWLSIKKEWKPLSKSLILAGAFMVRPELGVLALPLVLSLRARKPGNILLLVLPMAAAAGLWMLWNLHATGLPLPGTFYAKQAVSWPKAALSGLPGLLKGLLLCSPLLLFAAISPLFNLDWKNKREYSSRSLIFPLLFLTSLLLQPNSYFQMRYYVPAICAACLAAGEWLGDLGGRRRLNMAILILSMVPGFLIFFGRRMDASRDVRSIDVGPAEFLRGTSESEETVAAADIGAVGWITELNVLDLDGLVTPQRSPGGSIQGWDWIRSEADYLLVFPDQYSDLVNEGSGSLEFLSGFSSDRNVICGEDSVTLWRIE